MKLHVLTPTAAAVDRVRCHLLNWIGYWPNMVADPTKGYKLIRDLHSDRWCVIAFNHSEWNTRSSWELKSFIAHHGWAALANLDWLQVYFPTELVKLTGLDVPTKPGIYVSATGYTAARGSDPDRIIYLYDIANSSTPVVDLTTHLGLCNHAYWVGSGHDIHLPDNWEQSDWADGTRKLCSLVQNLNWPDRDIYLYTVEGNPLMVNGEPTDSYAYYAAMYLLLDWYSRTRKKINAAMFMQIVARRNQNKSWVTLHQIRELFRVDTVLTAELCGVLNAN